MQIYAVFTLELERLVCEDSGLGTHTQTRGPSQSAGLLIPAMYGGHVEAACHS